MLQPIIARRDDQLRARMLSSRSLHYDGGQRAVHAGSGLAVSGDRVCMVEDGADMIAVFSGQDSSVVGLPLTVGGRGPVAGKPRLHLEAMVASRDWRGNYLLAFGSGASPDHRSVVRVRLQGGDTELAVFETRGLYDALDRLEGFATSRLDLQGAALISHGSDGRPAIRLLQRGWNPAGGRPGGYPATVDFRLEPLLGYLERCKKDPSGWLGFELENPRLYDLGTIAGVPIGFTDAAALPSDRVVFLGAAEIVLDEGEPGEVLCSVLGVIEPDGSARYGMLLDTDGEPTLKRAEGLAVLDERRALVVCDQLDPADPALLCDVEISGL